jgi:hypothetical protein
MRQRTRRWNVAHLREQHALKELAHDEWPGGSWAK